MKSLKDAILEKVNTISKGMVEDWIRNNYEIDGVLVVSDDLKVTFNGGQLIFKGIRPKKDSLTNEMFEWGEINGDFIVGPKSSIKKPKDFPKKINGFLSIGGMGGDHNRFTQVIDCGEVEKVEDFRIFDCQGLTDIIATPRQIQNNFDVSFCRRLRSIEATPYEVSGNMTLNDLRNLSNLNMTTKHVSGDFEINTLSKMSEVMYPEEIGGTLAIIECNKLEALRNLPKRIGERIFLRTNKLLDKVYDVKIIDASNQNQWEECKNIKFG